MKKIKKDFKNTLMKKIKKEKIKPISKNFFIFKNILIYLFLGISIFIGAISVAIVFGYLFNADWSLSNKLGLFHIITTFLPIFWTFFLVIGIIISYFNFKNTKKGYKFYLWQIILGNILISFFLGLILYFSGFSQIIENKIQEKMPEYRQYFVGDKVSRMKKVWQNENKGLLLGQILEVNNFDSFKNFKLKDTNNKVWQINLNKNTVIKHNLDIQKGLKIKLIGEKKSENIFEVFEIRPFIGKGKGQKK